MNFWTKRVSSEETDYRVVRTLGLILALLGTIVFSVGTFWWAEMGSWRGAIVSGIATLTCLFVVIGLWLLGRSRQRPRDAVHE